MICYHMTTINGMIYNMKRNVTLILVLGLSGVIGLLVTYSFTDSNRVQVPIQSEIRMEKNSETPAFVNKEFIFEDTSNAESEKTRILENKVLMLQLTMDALKGEIIELKIDQNSESKQLTTETETPEERNPDSLENDEQIENEIFLNAHNTFEAQTVDDEWANTAQSKIETALYADGDNGLDISVVDCRSSICKLQIDQIDNDKLDLFKDDFREKVADVFEVGMAKKDENGNMIVLLGKDEQSLDLFQ